MEKKSPNTRISEYDVDPMFYERWSPRSYTPEPVAKNQLLGLFEAARWAPSCYNEQPWFFVYAIEQKDRERFLSALVEQNRVWAHKAPILVFLVSRKQFTKTGKENRHASFDCGAAWLSLALQARKSGLYAHAMAGFNRDKAHAICAVPVDEYTIHAAIAIGRRGAPEDLPQEIAKMEFPNARKSLPEIVFESKFTME